MMTSAMSSSNSNTDTVQTRRMGVRDEYTPKFGRQVLTLWSGWFYSDFEGTAVELPNHDGFMLTVDHFTWAHKVRVSCESPRTDENYERVDAAIETAYAEAEAAHASITAVDLPD